MKKILLTAIVAMFGMSAFAALPKAGDVGYLYNPASGKFIGADAKLADEGLQFTIEIKDKDKNATPSVEGALFMRFKAGSSYLTFFQKPASMSTYYGQLIVKDTDKGLLISHPYPNDQGPDWITAGSYLQVVDGELACVDLDEANEGAYWLYVDEPPYKKIVGPTYPIDLSGDAAKVAVAVNGEEATFTPTGTVQNQFQIKNMDISEFRAYGYKKIVVEFSGAAAGQFHAHAYENGNDPHWDIVTGVTGFNNEYDAPEWLSVGENKFEVELRADKDAIEDFTIFTWFDESAGAITVKAYFSKDELATSISSVKVAKAAKGIYNVAGQQMKNLQKGLNIVDGKKVYVK